jgi:hypothetical protein
MADTLQFVIYLAAFLCFLVAAFGIRSSWTARLNLIGLGRGPVGLRLPGDHPAKNHLTAGGAGPRSPLPQPRSAGRMRLADMSTIGLCAS